MKLYTFLLLIVCTLPKCSADDKLGETIRRNDPSNLNHLLVPGFFITSEEKKRYFTMAQKMTNATYEELHSISLQDIMNFVKGTAKVGVAALGGAALYAYWRGYADISQWSGYSDENPQIRNCRTNELSGHYRKGLYTGLAVLSSYLLCSGVRDFIRIIRKEHRLHRHKDALAVEAVIQRLPVCEPEECGRFNNN